MPRLHTLDSASGSEGHSACGNVRQPGGAGNVVPGKIGNGGFDLEGAIKAALAEEQGRAFNRLRYDFYELGIFIS